MRKLGKIRTDSLRVDQVVHDHHLMSSLQKLENRVASDVAGSTCNKNSHAVLRLCCCQVVWLCCPVTEFFSWPQNDFLTGAVFCKKGIFSRSL